MTVPCGTPESTGISLDILPSSTTFIVLPVRNLFVASVNAVSIIIKKNICNNSQWRHKQ